MHRLILSSAAVAALAACAPSTAPTAFATPSRVDADQCFRPSLVRNFAAPDDQTLYVRTSSSDVFQIEATFCRDMTRALSVALEPLSGSNLCVGDQATLRSPATGPQPCRVRIARKLTAEEIAALPSRDRP